jgi:hypothetical protein
MNLLLRGLGDILEGDVELLVGRDLLLLLLLRLLVALLLRGRIQIILDEILGRIAQKGVQAIDLLVDGVLQALVVLLDVAKVNDQSVAVGPGEVARLRQVLLLLRLVARKLLQKVLEQLLDLLAELVFHLLCHRRLLYVHI